MAAVVGYILGALPFGYLVARAHGVDIFKAGSGNPGATNVKRVLGARAGNTVFALDALKGLVAAGWPAGYCAVYPLPNALAGSDPEAARLLGLTGVIGAILGHSFSVFTRFKGGKGVATAAGGLVFLIPISCLVGAGVWVVTFFATRYVSLGSILAAVAVPAASWLLRNPLPLNIVVTIIGLFVIIRHRENLRRLLNGTENKFARKPPAG
ncbi:MAG: glycerol-3-phosphate 1-O-acyltransferase PlsY [Opitutaceae bacterium]|nr:glycerol-3-phosphate 1-O-acyltransferase PlsY [Opitutaceae bacterium]